MASSFGVKSRQSASSFSSRAYIYSPSAFSSSRSSFSARSSSPKPATVYVKSSSASSASSAAAAGERSPVKFQINRRSASPGGSISFQKNRVNNANAVPSNKKKAACMCSPTTHPGSFRCSLHKNSKNSVNTANRSQFQNESIRSNSSSTVNNSLARIGGDEGADLVKRALSAMIRHSSHQQRRRSAFQPRPSRLSVMSRAEDQD